MLTGYSCAVGELRDSDKSAMPLYGSCQSRKVYGISAIGIAAKPAEQRVLESSDKLVIASRFREMCF